MAWKRTDSVIPFCAREGRGKKRAEDWRTLGIIGAGRGCGVTHLTVWSGNWMQSVRNEKTVVLERNGHGDVQKLLKRCLEAEKGTVGSVLGVTYYPNAGEQEFLACMKENYRRILIDYGELTEKRTAEWLHCDRRILVGSLSEWQSGDLLSWLQRGTEWNTDWLAAAVFGSEEMRRSAEKEWRKTICRIPFSADAFTITRADMSFMNQLYGSRL